MKARDVMVSPVVTVDPHTSVKDVAKLFLAQRISGAPVVDNQGKLIGIISEGDLMHRFEAGTERQRSWWLRLLTREETLAAEFVKSHARKVADVMTQKVITAEPETPLHEIATLLERNAIKRLPIVKNGQLVGMITRANLVQAVASAGKGLDIAMSDRTLRDRVLAQLKKQAWAHPSSLNVMVSSGVVDLWGLTKSNAEKQAIRVLVESVPGVCTVNDHLIAGPIEVSI